MAFLWQVASEVGLEPVDAPAPSLDAELVAITILLVVIFLAIIAATRKPKGPRGGDRPKPPPHLPDSWWNP